MSLSVLLFLDLFEYFTVRKEHGDLFPPKIGWRLFYLLVGTCFLFFAIEYFTAAGGPQDKSSIWIAVLTFGLWLTRPKTLEASDFGLVSYSWFGLRKSSIAWNEVESISSEWENDEDYNRLAPFVRSVSVTVRGRKGRRLRLSHMQSGLKRFMQALQKHIPANAFGPGLRGWKP